MAGLKTDHGKFAQWFSQHGFGSVNYESTPERSMQHWRAWLHYTE